MPTVGYWYYRGQGEPIRSLLYFKGIEFEDKRYPIKTNSDGSFMFDEWLNDKYRLNLDFPNLPYFIDDKVRLTQSTTILRYLARKYDLAGQTEEERVRVELVEQQIDDLRTSMFRICYDLNSDFNKNKMVLERNAPAQIKQFSAFLGDRKFLAGDNITYVDFMAYDTFDFYRIMFPTILDDYPNLKEYQDRMKNLPELQEYFQSSTYSRWPILAPRAHFGGKGPEPKQN